MKTPKPRGPLEDELTLIVYGPDGKSIWSGPVNAVPRVGEDILITDPADNRWQMGGTVTRAMWMLRDQVSGQRVCIYLDEVVRPLEKLT